jgi:hypothetical protein
MKRLNFLILTFTLIVMVDASGCVATNPNLPNPGFTLVTVRTNALQIDSPVPGTLVSGQMIQRGSTASGTVESFPQIASTYPSGLIPVNNGVAPAFWRLAEHNGPCGGLEASGSIKRAEYNYLNCTQARISFSFSFIPTNVDAEAAPVTWTVKGQNMNCYYGMPTLQIYDYAGTLVSQTQATAIAADNSWIQGSSLSLQSLASGDYLVQVWNASGEFCGHTGMSIYRTSELPPDDDGDGYRSDVDCHDHDASIYPGAPTYCFQDEDRNCNGIDDYTDCSSGGPGDGNGCTNPLMECDVF